MPRVAACNPMFVKYAGKKRFKKNGFGVKIFSGLAFALYFVYHL